MRLPKLVAQVTGVVIALLSIGFGMAVESWFELNQQETLLLSGVLIVTIFFGIGLCLTEDPEGVKINPFGFLKLIPATVRKMVRLFSILVGIGNWIGERVTALLRAVGGLIPRLGKDNQEPVPVPVPVIEESSQ